MIIVICIAAIIILGGIAEAGLINTIFFLSPMVTMLIVYHVKTKKYNESHNKPKGAVPESKGLKYLRTTIFGTSAVELVLGVILFLVGIITAEDSYSYSSCWFCGGDECFFCADQGIIASNDPTFSPITWIGALLFLSGVVGLFTMAIQED